VLRTLQLDADHDTAVTYSSSLGVIIMAQPHVIAGVVSNAQGRPVPGARVYFTQAPVSLPDVAALTDEAGTFSLSVPAAGTYTIAAVADGFSPTAVTVTVTGDPKTQILINLNP
jgi:hypothetical protein